MAEDKWEQIIRKLMDKAEDSAATQAERDAIIERVSYLMAKYSLDEAILNSQAAEPEAVVNIRVKIMNPYVNQRMHLLDHIGRVFGCRSIHLEEYKDGKRVEILRMFGYTNDVQRSYMLFGSLLIQMFAAMATAQNEKPSGQHGRTFNSSFVTSYVDTVIQRVKAAYKKAKEDVKNTSTGNGMELVLVNRSAVVSNAFKAEYPYTRMGGYNPSSRSSAGSSAGRSAGHQANIGQTGVAGGRMAIGS